MREMRSGLREGLMLSDLASADRGDICSELTAQTKEVS